jgi:hypothetical protein
VLALRHGTDARRACHDSIAGPAGTLAGVTAPSSEVADSQPPRQPRPAFREHVSSRRERVLLAGIGFVVTIAIARTATGVLHAKGAGADGGLVVAGVHLHHFVFGIAIVFATSLSWLLLGGIDDERHWWFRVTAIAYGVGTALVLDEYALWLNMKDVYWQQRGRQSIEAIGVFVAVLMLALLVRPYGSARWKHRRAGRPG